MKRKEPKFASQGKRKFFEEKENYKGQVNGLEELVQLYGFGESFMESTVLSHKF